MSNTHVIILSETHACKLTFYYLGYIIKFK